MRRPNGEWTTELGRQNGYQNGPALPANAQKAITLQMYRAWTASCAAATRSTTAQTWTEIGDGFPLDRARRTPGIGVSAYNGTGAEVGTFEAFTVGEPPDLPPTPPCESRTRRRRATRCCSTARTRRSRTGRTPAAARFVREGCTIKSVGAFGLLYTKQDYEAPVLAQARVDDARRRQLRRLRRLPRHRGEHGPDVDLAGRGDPDRPDGQPGPDHGRDLPRAGGGRRRPRRGPQAAGSVERVRDRRAGRPHRRLSSTARRSTSGSTTTRTSISPRATSACRRTGRATTSTSATCGSRTSPRSRYATRRRRRPPIRAGHGRQRQQRDRDGFGRGRRRPGTCS